MRAFALALLLVSGCAGTFGTVVADVTDVLVKVANGLSIAESALAQACPPSVTTDICAVIRQIDETAQAMVGLAAIAVQDGANAEPAVEKADAAVRSLSTALKGIPPAPVVLSAPVLPDELLRGKTEPHSAIKSHATDLRVLANPYQCGACD